METKKCSKCGEVKPLVEYGTYNGVPNKMTYCKVCNNKRGKIYRDNNVDKEKKRRKNNYDSEYFKVYKKQYRLENKEKIQAYQIKFKEMNPNYYNEYFHKRYHNDSEFRFGHLVSSHLKGVSNRQEFKEIWDDVREVYDMYGVSYHIDHMVPKNWFLVRTPKHLINHLDNLQVIDADYNTSKQDRWSDPVPSEYLDKIRPYIKKKFEGLLKSL